MKFEIMNGVSRKLGRVGLHIKKHSPEILLATGVVGGIVSAVMACKATTKVGEIIEAAKMDIDVIHESVENGRIVEVNDDGERTEVPCTQEDAKKYLAGVYLKTGVKFVKLYGPAVTLGIASITCILASHNIIRKRNVALTAAYATIDNSFKEYRSRVVDRFGKEIDRELRYNIKAREVEEVVVDEDGNEKTVKKIVDTVDPTLNSDYARFFDETCLGWTRDADYNLMFLRQMQNWANDKLKSQGHLYLNEVYKMLGIPTSKAGQVVGWIYDDKNEVGDNYVDFGIYDLHNEQKRLFVNGHEKSILLDFNVDGNIWEMMS